jgi:hypothetical protein
LANAITRPVIELYELIKHIVDKGKGAETKLSFKNTNMELNNIHRTFNQIVKTMQVAKSASTNEDPSQALLYYYEAVDIFSKFKNHKAMGMCYNNIGCLHFGQGDFLKAETSFKSALEEIKNENQETKMSSLVEMSRTF